MLVYRIYKSKYANDPLSAEGAKRAGGRWNPKGFPLLYTSATPELALLEVIAHFDPSYIPNYYLLVLNIPDPSRHLTPNDLPSSWKIDTPYDTTTQNFLLDWLENPDSLVVGVPSLHPSFVSDVQIVENRVFKLNLRLVKGAIS